MRKLFHLIIMSGLLFMLISCSMNSKYTDTGISNNLDDKPGMEGYVVDKESGRIISFLSITQLGFSYNT